MKLCPKCQKQFSDDANFCPVDAARLVPLEGQPEAASAADPLTQRFQLGGSLGGSRTGVVHRAVDTQTGAAAAVKLISPAVVALPGVAQRLERELKQLERVQSVGVARVLASGRRGEDWWVAYELVDGAQTLAEAITARGPIPLDEAAHLVEVIGEALIEAAQVGVVHRDLAPKNVLFAGGDIKLINFSVPVPAERTPGVPEFVAPEQVEGKAVDQRSNLYSLGALYYYVLTGQTVHAGSPEEVHHAHVHGAIQPPSQLVAVPAAVEAVILRALDRSPTKRFLTVRQFVDEVGRVARGDSSSVRSTMPMGKAGRPKSELVQTLLGMRGGSSPAIVPPGLGPDAAPASAPVAAPMAPVVPRAPLVPGAVAAITEEPFVGATIHGVGPSAAAVAAAVAASPSAQGRQAPVEAPPMMAPVAVGPDQSPWAAPAASSPVSAPLPEAPPMAAVAAVPVATVAPAPAPASVQVAAPPAAISQPPREAAPPQPRPEPAAVKAPVVGQAASASATGSRKKVKEEKGKDGKGKFRETLWFKKGELDAQAAEERAKSGRDTAGEGVDSLPIDERYKDDGTISRGDKEKYSLRTGGTEMMPRLRESGASAKVSEDELIGEMKAGRGKILALIGLGLIVLVVIIVFVVR
jgi:hypothetical protein